MTFRLPISVAAGLAALSGASSLCASPVPCAPQDGAAKPAAAAPATSDARPGLDLAFPQNTLFFFGIDNLDQLRADWSASPWGRLYADPANESLRKAFGELFAELGATSTKEVGVDLVETFGFITGRLGFGAYGRLDDKGGEQYGFTAGFESAEHVTDLRARAQKLLDKASEDGRLVQKQETEGDVEVTLAVRKEPAVDEPDLRVAVAGPLLLIDGASGDYREKPRFASALAALRGEGKESLGASAAFKESVAGKPGGAKLWFDSGALIRERLGDGSNPDDFEAGMMRQLGLGEFGPLTARLDLNATELRIEALQSWTGKGSVASMLTAWLGTGDTTLLRFVPTEADKAIALHLDFQKGMDAVKALEKEMNGGEEPPAPPADADPNAPREPDPRKDFLDHLDGRIAVFIAPVDVSEAMPMSNPALPISVCVVLGVKNPEPLRANLERTLRDMGIPNAARKKSEFQGFQYYTVPITPLSISYAVLDDIAVLSLSPTLLQDVLRRKSDKELKNLGGDPGFKRQTDGLTFNPSVLFWSKIDPNSLAMLGAQVPPEALDQGPDALPRLLFSALQSLGQVDPTVAHKYLPSGSVVGFGVDEKGLKLEGVSR